MTRPRVVICSPALTAVSGVSTHANLLLHSPLASEFELLHFQVGSEGRREGRVRKAIRLAGSPFALANFLRRHRPAILHLNSSMDHKAYWRDALYRRVAHLLGIKVVMQIHGGPMPAAFLPLRRLAGVLRRSLEASDAIAVLSSEEQAAYAAFCPTARVLCIPNAIDPAGLLGAIVESDRLRPLRLVYIGRLLREKGLFEVLGAIARLQAAGRRVVCDIAGSGPALAELEATALRLGVRAAVTFHGPLFGAAKAALWRQADLLAFPTYHPEGLPYSLLEAMAAGTPAITCAVAAIPDVMEHGVHGLFVPPRDAHALAAAIAACDHDRTMLYRMALAGRARIEQAYTVARLSRDFSRLYHQLLGSAHAISGEILAETYVQTHAEIHAKKIHTETHVKTHVKIQSETHVENDVETHAEADRPQFAGVKAKAAARRRPD